MKKWISGALISSTCLLVISSQAFAGLISYFPFEGNANDVAGGYTSTVSGATLTTGHTGQAYLFDGSNDYIMVSLNINPGALPQLTMGAWVKADTGNPIRQIISHDNGGYDRSLGIDHRGGSTGWSAFSGTGSVLGAFPVTTGDWTFVAVSYDQATSRVTLYVDGNTKSETGTPGTGHSTLRIGSNPSYGEFFSGTVDDVFFFDQVLTTSQLDHIRINGVQPVPVPPALLLLGSGLVGLAGVRKRVRK